VHRLYIYSIRPNLPDLSGLQTIGRECSAKTTSRIETESIGSHTESLGCPVTIDDEFLSCIALIPWSPIDESDKCSYLFRSLHTILRMESTMHEDELISLDDMRQRT
jgi:hypothetical protein